MKPLFSVDIVLFRLLEELPGVWTSADYAALLGEMEVDSVGEFSDEELREVCIMSMQDLEPEAAAELLLRYRLGDRLSSGQISNMASEMIDEKLWEGYADFALHEELFNVGSLLYCVAPAIFPEPDAVQLTMEVVAENPEARRLLADEFHEPLLVRLLADGMEERAVLHRMFSDQLAARHFPEAPSIVWTVATKTLDGDKVSADLVSSGYWLDTLRETRSYSSNAHADD